MRRREPELQSFQTGPLALTLLMLKPLTTKGMQYHEGKTVAQLLRACSFPLWAFVSCVVNASRNRYLSSRAPGEDAVQSRQNQLMEIKRTISRIAYRIEPKPEGGFIGRCSDPNVPPLEAASRFELEQQIQAKITAEMESQFPGLKIHLDQSATKLITLETKPDGSIFPESVNSSLQPVEGGTKKAIEQWLTDKAVTLVEKNLSPELVEQLKHQPIDGKITIAVTKVGAEAKSRREYVISVGNASALLSR